jgi:glycine dehydrogenase subunit 1
MEYAPHTEPEIAEMLGAIGVASIDELFEVIPESIRLTEPLALPQGRSESEIVRAFSALAASNKHLDELICFAGAGSYDHRVPAFVWPILSRGEFLTAYTPYQPELSQGGLQALFEYQSMIASLTGLAVSNAGLYDGATALSEGVNVAVAATRRQRIVVAGALHPFWLGVLRTQAAGLGLEIVTTPMVPDTDLVALERILDTDTAAVILQTPNLFGCLEDVPSVASRAHAVGARMILATDLSLSGILEAPAEQGVDIVVADGQVFGNHLNFGGPAAGIIAVGEQDMRRLPGRLVGQTTDRLGRRAFVLTLQAREQHIRREKATSNICTNQTLNTLAIAMTMAWLGPQGLKELGEQVVARAHYACSKLIDVAGAERIGESPFVKEFAVRLPVDATKVVQSCVGQGILAGVPLRRLDRTADARTLLVAVTEQRTLEEIDRLADAVARACKENA